MVPLEGRADKFRLQQFPLGVSELLFAPQVVLDLAQGVSSGGVGQENLSAKRHCITFKIEKLERLEFYEPASLPVWFSPYMPV